MAEAFVAQNPDCVQPNHPCSNPSEIGFFTADELKQAREPAHTLGLQTIYVLQAKLPDEITEVGNGAAEKESDKIARSSFILPDCTSKAGKASIQIGNV
jgi:hypothetical protein